MKLFYRRPRAISAALVLSFWTTAAAAQALVPYDRVGRPYFDAGIGAFEPQSSNHLENQDGQGAGIVGVGYRASRHFAWGGEITGGTSIMLRYRQAF